MNYMIPGFGDEVTWGGRTPTQHLQYFTVGFEMTIGLQGARVTVVAEVDGYEISEIKEVLYCDLDIFPALDSCTHIDIRNHYERNAEQINAKNSED